jgi:hypothetical protein
MVLPLTMPASLIVWCGARNGRRFIGSLPAFRIPVRSVGAFSFPGASSFLAVLPPVA